MTVLAFGCFLLVALSIALLKLRVFQAATAPEGRPSPPFRKPPSAARYLQLALSLTAGGLGGLGVACALAHPCPIIAGVISGVALWVLMEWRFDRIVSGPVETAGE